MFDNNNLLSTNYKIFDLYTGYSRNRTKNDYCTYEVDSELFSSNILCKKVEKYVSSMFVCDENVDKLQKILGSCICENFDGIIYKLYGQGSNGKTTFISLLLGVLKNIAIHLDIDDYINDENNNFVDVIMSYKLIIINNNTQENVQLFVDKIVSYHKHSKMRPKCKILFVSNEQYNDFEKENVISVFFPIVFDKNHAIYDIHNTMSGNLNELLAWLIKGAIKYNSEGLENVTKFTDMNM
jgi:phage/plasmid-associated DNA primase